MATWRLRKCDERGVIDLGPMPGRGGRKQIRQYVQGIAVRAQYPGLPHGLPLPISSAMREALEARIRDGSAIAYESDGVLFAAEQVRDADGPRGETAHNLCADESDDALNRMMGKLNLRAKPKPEEKAWDRKADN